MKAKDEIGAENGQKHVTAAEKHGTNFEEVKKHGGEAERVCGSRSKSSKREDGAGARSGEASALANQNPEQTSGDQKNENRGAEGRKHHDSQRQQSQGKALQRGSRKVPNGLGNQGNDDGLDANQQAGHLGNRAVRLIGPSERHNQDRGGKNETCSGYEQAGETAANFTQVNGEFGRTGAGEKIDGAEQVEEALAGQPVEAADEALLHHGDVRRRSAESDKTEAKKFPGELREGAASRGIGHRRILHTGAGHYVSETTGEV